MSDVNPETTVVLGAGGVEYSLTEAATPIQNVIDALLEAQADGAEFVVLPSGNYRGAQWQRLYSNYTWASEE